MSLMSLVISDYAISEENSMKNKKEIRKMEKKISLYFIKMKGSATLYIYTSKNEVID